MRRVAKLAKELPLLLWRLRGGGGRNGGRGGGGLGGFGGGEGSDGGGGGWMEGGGGLGDVGGGGGRGAGGGEAVTICASFRVLGCSPELPAAKERSSATIKICRVIMS